jgi:hypothetical protein
MKVSALLNTLNQVYELIPGGADYDVKIVIEGVEKDISEFRVVGADKVYFPQVITEDSRVKIKVE